MKKREMELTVQVFNSFEEAEKKPTRILVVAFAFGTLETSKVYSRN